MWLPNGDNIFSTGVLTERPTGLLVAAINLQVRAVGLKLM